MALLSICTPYDYTHLPQILQPPLRRVGVARVDVLCDCRGVVGEGIMIEYKSRFKYADRVNIDGDKSIIASVTGVMWRNGHHLVEIGWINGGSPTTIWIDEYRLELAKR